MIDLTVYKNDYNLRSVLHKLLLQYGEATFRKFLVWFVDYRGNNLNEFTGKDIIGEQWPLFEEKFPHFFKATFLPNNYFLKVQHEPDGLRFFMVRLSKSSLTHNEPGMGYFFQQGAHILVPFRKIETSTNFNEQMEILIQMLRVMLENSPENRG